MWALITLSGQTSLTSRNDVWCGLAEVLAAVQGNIEDAAGHFMQTAAGGGTADEEPDACTQQASHGALGRRPKGTPGRGAASSRNASDLPNFLVGAFNTTITPFAEDDADSRITGVAIFLKARVQHNCVNELSQMLHQRFPELVCTVTIVGGLEQDAASASSSQQRPRTPTGAIYLFGYDRAGQLARISEVLQKMNVTILDLQVRIGHSDPETFEFLEGPGPGGQLSENVVHIAAFDRAVFDEALLSEEVLRVASEIGYQVSATILDHQSSRAQELATYYLRRKDFLAELQQRRADSALASS